VREGEEKGRENEKRARIDKDVLKEHRVLPSVSDGVTEMLEQGQGRGLWMANWCLSER
jgi:hypothetical protein